MRAPTSAAAWCRRTGVHCRTLFELGRKHAQTRIDSIGRRVQRRIEHDVAARNRIFMDVASTEVKGAAIAGLPDLGRAVLGVNAAHVPFAAGRTDDHTIANGNAAGEDRAGYHRASAGQRETTVHREAEAPRGCPAAEGSGCAEELFAQMLNTDASHR